MTVPSLMQNYQRQSYVSQINKIYNELMQASQRYITEHNALNLKEAGITSNEALDNFIKSSFKIINDCGSEQTPCFAAEGTYRKLSGAKADTGQKYNVTLASGAAFAYSYIGTDKIAIIDVDINGQKGPNIAGRDVFILGLFNNGLVDDYGASSAPASKETREELFNNNCNSSGGSWYGCFGKLLNDNWQMTY